MGGWVSLYLEEGEGVWFDSGRADHLLKEEVGVVALPEVVVRLKTEIPGETRPGVGGWVGGRIEEKEAVGMSCCNLGVGKKLDGVGG